MHRPIKSDLEYSRALKEIEGLMNARANSPEGKRLNALVARVEVWEQKHNPLHTFSS
jgi:HTH-type transcriptional regulator/antitoxin HigA